MLRSDQIKESFLKDVWHGGRAGELDEKKNMQIAFCFPNARTQVKAQNSNTCRMKANAKLHNAINLIKNTKS
jgi:hypothetical protein